MKCAPTIGAPATTGRVRSTTEASSLSITAITAASGGAGVKTLADFFLGQIAPDKDDTAFALLAVLPWALMVTVQNHVHALEHEPIGIVLERQNAFAAQNVR